MGCTPSQAPSERPPPASKQGKVSYDASEIQVEPCRDRAPSKTNTSAFHSKYILEKKLGKGAFAQVYLGRLAKEQASSATFAVKILDLRGNKEKTDWSLDAATVRAAEKEVDVFKTLGRQRNCIALHDHFSEGIFCYMVMDLCDHTLLHVLERTSELTELTYVRIFREMLTALAAVHRTGIVHRDVKPDNFLMVCEKDGQQAQTVYLCDFGLAAEMSSKSGGLKGVYGTAPFMSPEMLNGSPYDYKTDVWSLGAMAYVLLFGTFPYQPAESSAKAMKAAIVAGTPKPAFKARARSDGSENAARATSSAVAALQKMLTREMEKRVSATEALEENWFSQTPERPITDYPSLRQIFHCSKRVGAFDTRVTHNDYSSDMDTILAQLQTEQHGSKAGLNKYVRPGAMNKFNSETSTDSTAASNGGTSNASSGTMGGITCRAMTPERAPTPGSIPRQSSHQSSCSVDSRSSGQDRGSLRKPHRPERPSYADRLGSK